MNETMRKFGYPETRVGETAHWVILLRPAQVTLGSLVVAAKSEVTAFGNLSPEYHADLSVVTRRAEAMLARAVDFQRINWMMLMMVDPHVHFHVLPRYEGTRARNGLVLADAGWPGPPDLKSAVPLNDRQRDDYTKWLSEIWSATA